MTDAERDSLNIEVAELVCEWTALCRFKSSPGTWRAWGVPPGNIELWLVPNYCGSLDACREAELRMLDRQLFGYFDKLFEITGTSAVENEIYSGTGVVLATAEQRCRAMLASLEPV